MELYEIVTLVVEVLFIVTYVASLMMRQEPKEKRELVDTLATSFLIMISVIIGSMPLDNTLFVFLFVINLSVVLTGAKLSVKARKEKAKDEELSEKVQEVQ